MSVNKQIIVGTLGKSPEVRTTQKGEKVASFSVGTSFGENTDWHNIVLYGKLADDAEASLQKGHLVYLEGRTRTRKWQDREGKDRYTTEVVGSYLASQPVSDGAGISVNKQILLGRLGKAPESHDTRNGGTFVTFSVATNYGDNADWHNVLLFDKLAEVAEKYLDKGDQVYIEGRTRTRKYEKDGQDRYITEVIGSFLDLQPNGKENSDSTSSWQSPGAALDDEIPF